MPAYTGSVQNLQTLRTAAAPAFSVGDFSDAPSTGGPGSIKARAWELQPQTDSFAGYLKAALANELESAGKYQADSPLRISGVVLDNRLDASGVNYGTAAVSARFTVTNAGATVYEKILNAESRWESSFFGEIAIPAAVRNYIGTFQKLLNQLFADPEFQQLGVHKP